MENTDEILLIKSSQAGDIDSFERLIERYKQKVYGIAMNMTKNRDDAFDVSQDVLIRIYKSIGKFGFRSSFSTWVYRITVNCCMDHIKKQNRVVLFSASEHEGITDNMAIESMREKDTPESVLERKIQKEEIRKALDQLEPEFKIAVILRDIEGLSYEEIGKIGNMSLGTVKSRISRGRRKLREILAGGRQGGDSGEL